MKKAAQSSKKNSNRTKKRGHFLHGEIPTINTFVVIFYILIFILGVGIYVVKV